MRQNVKKGACTGWMVNHAVFRYILPWNHAQTQKQHNLTNIYGTLKFIHSGKATNFCEISTVDLSYVVTVKSTVEICKILWPSQNI